MIGFSENLALLTDQYELTMAEAYCKSGMFAPATFSLFVREYPPDRGYFVSAGLEDVLDYLESLHFSQKDCDYLARTGTFSSEFLTYLPDFNFTGTVRAMPEGRIFFKDEPILEVTAPIIEAQIAESFIINAIGLQTLVASKAARCVHAADGRNLIDFSLRRTQGIDAGLKVARASYLVGFAGTSNVLAGKLYDIPVFGTMAHAFITSFEEEIDAFRAFADTFPEGTVLLIDTYDTVTGARKAVEVAAEMAKRGRSLKGFRLDSGDMIALSKEVRAIFDEAGFTELSILASGGFDEFKIARYVKNGAEINGFGVGTKMGVSADAPYLDIAYKLVQYDDRPVLKLSSGKKTLVGEKQVFRTWDGNHMDKDTIALRQERLDGDPLLEPYMENGERVRPPASHDTIRTRFRSDFNRLNPKHTKLENPEEFFVELGPELQELQKELIHEVREKELGES